MVSCLVSYSVRWASRRIRLGRVILNSAEFLNHSPNPWVKYDDPCSTSLLYPCVYQERTSGEVCRSRIRNQRKVREIRKLNMVMEEEIVIVGAGIAGLATAVALRRVGIRALVLERSDRLRASGAALTLGPNAWLALDALGVAQKLTPRYPVRQKYGFYSFIFLHISLEFFFL